MFSGHTTFEKSADRRPGGEVQDLRNFASPTSPNPPPISAYVAGSGAREGPGLVLGVKVYVSVKVPVVVEPVLKLAGKSPCWS
jgi:hypothetical protein